MKYNPIKISLIGISITLAANAFASNHQTVDTLETAPKTIEYTFPVQDYDGNTINENTILANLAQNILENTPYPTIAKKAPCSSWSSKEECAIRTGTYVKIDKNTLHVEFHNVKNEHGAITANLVESDVYNNTTFDLKISTEINDDKITAKVLVPNQIIINSSNMLSITRYKPLAEPMQLRNDIISMINPDKVALKMYHLETGEIDNQYTPDSVYGNLTRLTGKYNWSTFPSCDIQNLILSRSAENKTTSTMDTKPCMPTDAKMSEKQQAQQLKWLDKAWDISDEQAPNTFRYKLDDKFIPVNAVAYPYQTRSKITYKAIVPYTISSNGATSINQDAMKQMVGKFESAIAQ